MKPCKLVTLFISTALLSSPSFAAVSLKGEEMPMATPYQWTGFYAGLNVGVVKYTMNMTDNQGASFLATIQQTANPKFTGGFQLGYRYQLDLASVSGVYGLEFSGNFSNAQFSKTYGSPFALYEFKAKNELQNLWLLQLIGGIAADKTLLFLAAGFSYTNISGNVTTTDAIPFFNAFSVHKKAFGTALGGGVEYAFSKRFSARLKVDVITPNTYTTYDNTGNSYDIANNIVQGTFGINYKFA